MNELIELILCEGVFPYAHLTSESVSKRNSTSPKRQDLFKL